MVQLEEVIEESDEGLEERRPSSQTFSCCWFRAGISCDKGTAESEDVSDEVSELLSRT